MPDFLDDKEKKYITYFGEPVLVAHDVYLEPHVDVYIFTNQEETRYFYFTKGLEEAGFRELLAVTAVNERWPIYLLQVICDYLIIEKRQVKKMETFENTEDIQDANGFNYALFLETSVVGLNQRELKKELGLTNYPLYVFPLTGAELEYSLEKGASSLLKVIHDKTSLLGDVNRKSVV